MVDHSWEVFSIWSHAPPNLPKHCFLVYHFHIFWRIKTSFWNIKSISFLLFRWTCYFVYKKLQKILQLMILVGLKQPTRFNPIQTGGGLIQPIWYWHISWQNSDLIGSRIRVAFQSVILSSTYYVLTLSKLNKNVKQINIELCTA